MILINTKDFLRLGVPLGQVTRLATDFISRFILGGGAIGARTSVRFTVRTREALESLRLSAVVS